MKWPIKLLLIGIIAPLLYQFCEKKTDGFRISRLSTTCASHPIASSPDEIEPILRQKFHYLSSGGQCWVFASEDGAYVLKFFKAHVRAKKGKLEEDLKSCALCALELKEESGLVYLHVDPTTSLKPIHIVDKLRIEHSLDINKTDFLLQKKGILLYDYLQLLMDQGNQAEAKRALSSLCRLIVKRCEKGIFDEDPRLHCNIGFVGNHPIFLDTGRMRRDEKRKNPSIYLKDLKKMTRKLHTWLQKHYPELSTHLEKESAL